MRKPTLVKDYSKLNEANLELKSTEIIANLTGNVNFPVTVPSLADFTLIKDNYSSKLIAAGNGDKSAIAFKNESKQQLLDNLRFLAINIESQAMGNRAKMVTSGFDLAGSGENVPVLNTPENFKLSDGINPGEIRSEVKRVAQAKMYSHEYCLEPPTENTVWISHMVSTREFTFTGLPSGTRVYVRVAVIGSKKQIAYSVVLSRIVQ